MDDSSTFAPLTEEADGLAQILASIPPAPAEPTALANLLGHFTGEELMATVPSPPFDCSSMDGYALGVGSSGFDKGDTFRLVDAAAPAGSAAGNIGPGEAMRIFTGAPIPSGTHAVAMQEDVVLDDSEIRLSEAYQSGEFIRRAGADLCQGQLLLHTGNRITPQRLAALASQGRASFPASPRTPVGVLTTGDELIPPGSERAPAQIYNSNASLVGALVEQAGGRVSGVAHGIDDRAQLLKATRPLHESSDFLVSCGGVSVGDHDHVRWLVNELGFETVFWRVNMQPGKPFLFAAHPDGKWFFGLPGNPASALVCFHRFVAPAIRHRMGATTALVPPPTVLAILGSDVASKGMRPHYLRGSLVQGVFQPLGLQQSHAIAGMAASDALLRIPADTALAEGSKIDVSRL